MRRISRSFQLDALTAVSHYILYISLSLSLSPLSFSLRLQAAAIIAAISQYLQGRLYLRARPQIAFGEMRSEYQASRKRLCVTRARAPGTDCGNKGPSLAMRGAGRFVLYLYICPCVSSCRLPCTGEILLGLSGLRHLYFIIYSRSSDLDLLRTNLSISLLDQHRMRRI